MKQSKMERALRLSVRSSILLEHAITLADHSNHARAARAVALSNALHHAAGGDKEAAKSAFAEARFWRNFERKNANV